MPAPASLTRVRPRSVACHGWGASRCSPCMLPALRWPRCHGTHGDGRDRGRQRRAVPWPVLPEPCGISGEVPAGRHPGHRSAVRAVQLGPIRAVASPLLYRCGRVEGGALLQRLRALPRRDGGRGRLREALRTPALRVRVVRVLPAVLRGRPGKEQELVYVPVALCGGRVAER